jgi:hypothetical protein
MHALTVRTLRQYIEGVYKQSKFVANAFVYGDSKQASARDMRRRCIR